MILKFITSLFIITSCCNCLEWKFPDDFKFGVATSAYQIEGGWNADGKGANIWDTLTHNRSSRIKDGGNADVACDSYHKWEEDIQLVKNLRVDYYRISLSWTRILPYGTTSRINQPGVEYYNKIINKLIENGIEPVLTIYHWDLPERFSALGGWTNPVIIEHFANYARKTFEFFGDRVKLWITVNEPRLICQAFKGLTGDITPDFPLGIAEYLCAHNILKAHAEAYHIYDKEFRHKQKGKISITLDFSWTEPANASNPEDVRAADLFVQSEFGIFANPIFKFDYPKVLIQRLAERSKLENYPGSRLPKFTLAEKMRISGTHDFLGINHYITLYGKAAKEPPVSTPNIELDFGGERFIDPNWEGGAAEWIYLVPWGLRHLLKFIKHTYKNPEIIITENGYADGPNATLDDYARINYYRQYLNATLQAIHEDGVNVKAYMAWSLIDNFEWTYGYTLRFGLYHVDFAHPNRTRTPKKSVEYFKNVTKTRTIS